MGNNQSAPSTLDHFSKRFIRSPHPADPEQNSLFLLHERLSQNKFILRILRTGDEEERNKKEQMICKKLAMSKLIARTRLLTPIDHYLFQDDQGYCNVIQKVFILFDLTGAESLSHHLTRGYYNNSMQKVLDEETVHRGLLNLVNAVALLRHFKHPHQHINCDSIYLCDNTFMLSDPWMVINSAQKYYSPENLLEMKNQLEKQDPYLSDLFAIGIVGLKILGNHDIASVYSNTKKTINFQKLFQKVGECKNQKLRILLMKLLGSTSERQMLLKQIKLKQIETQNFQQVRTRNLCGKVSSVRRSFKHDERPIATFTHNHQTSSSAAHTRHINSPYPSINNPSSQFHLPLNINFDQKTMISTNHQSFLPSFQPGSLNNQTLRTNSSQNLNVNTEGLGFKKGHTTTRATLAPHSPSLGIANIGMIEENSLSSNNSQPDIRIGYDNLSTLKNMQSAPRAQVINNASPSTAVKFGFQAKASNGNTNSVSSNTPYSTVSIQHNKLSQKYPYNSKEIEPFRISPGYLDSTTFEGDKDFHKRTMEKIKELQDKVSQAIRRNSNSINVMEQRHSSLVSPINISPKASEHSEDKDARNIVESLVMVNKSVEEDIDIQVRSSAGFSRKGDEIRVQESISSENDNDRKNELQFANVEKESAQLRKSDKKIQLEQKISQILGQQQQVTQNREELPIKQAKKTQEQVQNQRQLKKQQQLFDLMQKIKKQVEEEEKRQLLQANGNNLQKNQPFATPQKTNSNPRFDQINNQTIPEQSDQQSREEAKAEHGDFVEEIYQNGGKYIGYMRDGKRNGEGTFYYRDGGYYAGRWKNNMMNGFGKLYYETGRLAYEGQWYKDEFHGRGKVYNDAPEEILDQSFDFKNMNGTQTCWKYYEGDLSHDTKAGFGKLMLSNDEYFQGEFRNDQVHGWGTYHCKDGSIVKGYWQEGLLIKQG